jgi:hypothetical protein
LEVFQDFVLAPSPKKAPSDGNVLEVYSANADAFRATRAFFEKPPIVSRPLVPWLLLCHMAERK